MAGSDSSHGVSRVVKHRDFYLHGGDVTFLVENHLYRVHSYFFTRESLFFRQKFNDLNNTGDELPGSTDSNAFTLDETKSEDFARLLWVFYNPKYSLYDAPLETWLSILKLANRWTFDSVKELSVRELEKLEIEPIEKIAIYHDHNISRLYLVPSYIAVCKRDKSLSFSEGMKLGMETVLRIAEARERLRLQASESGIRTPTFEDFEDNEVEMLVREIFNLGSRPTSPAPVTSPASGVNGAVNGVPLKLGPAPLGKANGAGSRANGGSAADPRSSSVNSMPSIGSVMARQESATPTATPPPATQPTASPATAEQRPPAPPAKTMSPSLPATTPLAAEKAKDQAASPKSGGVGEPSSSADSSQVSSSHDIPISRPVVSPAEHSVDVTAKSKDSVNGAERDKSIKDNDATTVPSDNEKQAAKNKRGGRTARSGNK